MKTSHQGGGTVKPAFAAVLKEADGALRRVVSVAVLGGLPVLALASALGYFDSCRRGRGTANGAHGFDRIDGTGSHHGPWGSGLNGWVRDTAGIIPGINICRCVVNLPTKQNG